MASNRKSAVDIQFIPKTGLDAASYKNMADALGPVLAESYQLFIKTQGVHWNVSGPNFFSLHKLTEGQYQELYAAIDVIAERIRTLGSRAPATYSSYGAMSSIKDEEEPANTDDMVRMLIRDNGILCKTLRSAIDVADDCNDVVTADMLTARLSRHEQSSWMLNMVLA